MSKRPGPKAKGADQETPLMRQFNAIKAKHRDEILLFRMGDFYEMFGADAREAAPILGITLTSRRNGKAADVSLAGFPHHAATPYIKKLVRAGRRVAVCEQVEDPKKAKGIVRREVIEVVTPGTLVSDELLEGAANNYLVACALPSAGSRRGEPAGLARVDLSTGEFRAGEVLPGDLVDELARIRPGEILVSRDRREELCALLAGELVDVPCTGRDDWEFETHQAQEVLKAHFGTQTLAGFGFDGLGPSVAAAGAALAYLQEARRSALPHLASLARLATGDVMLLDAQTRRNLELTARADDGRGEGTLLSVLDRTVNAMGARRLRRWLTHPLRVPSRIHERQLAVEALHDSPDRAAELVRVLGGICDVERVVARISVRRVSPRDLAALRDSVSSASALAEVMGAFGARLLSEAVESLPSLAPLSQRLEAAVAPEPPARATDPGVIADGFSEDLDELRLILRDGRAWISDFQAREQKATGISSLKIKQNRVFGYYIEVTKSNLGMVPEHYRRKQTTSTGERFVTDELASFEDKLAHAEERAGALEAEIFAALVDDCLQWIGPLQAFGATVALADVIQGLATVAREQSYVRPIVDDGPGLDIIEGRHPVLDATEMEEAFVPNDLALGNTSRIHLITGPNMAGKSTYLRQVGLIVLLAQVGAFVPAESARIGVVDRIFTRVGTSDDLLRGRSTFLVEMVETAAILHNAGERSLVLLDEIGRGTSTYDGLALAWAITEHLARAEERAPRTLFATHYHELTELVDELPFAANYTTSVREHGEAVVFLRRIVAGTADRSYGIHVARMAGVPRGVIRRARQVLARLETGRGPGSSGQLDLFSAPPVEVEPEHVPHPLVEEFSGIDPDDLAPREALDLLYRWKNAFSVDTVGGHLDPEK